MNQETTFGELAVGDHFEVMGDDVYMYDYPKRMRCVKRSEHSAEEIDGSLESLFLMNDDDDVFVVKVEAKSELMHVYPVEGLRQYRQGRLVTNVRSIE